MRTRRDQVRAYRFVTRRIVSAMLSGEPETTNLPMRRLGLAVFSSAILAAVVLAGAGVYGLVTKRGAPLDAETLVIEEETGATYVYLEGKLHPVLNYASARLVLGAPEPTTRTMSRSALKDTPRGLPVGIPDAPDALPDPKALVKLPWQVCQTPGAAGSANPTSWLVAGRRLAGGQRVGGDALLVKNGETTHLLVNDRRLLVDGDATLAALGLTAATPIAVGEQFVNAIPAGPKLFRIPINGAGEESPRQVAGKNERVGQVFRSAGQHYALTKEGLSPIGDVYARLRLNDGGEVKEITPNDVAGALSDTKIEPEGFPQRVPALHPAASQQTTLCVSYEAGPTADSPAARIEAYPRTPAELSDPVGGGVAVRQTGRDPVSTVERVVIPGGRGAVVRVLPGGSATAAGTTEYLLNDQGIKFPLATGSGDAKSSLGYGSVSAIGLPADVLDLIPTGPTLDQAAAKQFVGGQTEDGKGQQDGESGKSKQGGESGQNGGGTD